MHRSFNVSLRCLSFLLQIPTVILDYADLDFLMSPPLTRNVNDYLLDEKCVSVRIEPHTFNQCFKDTLKRQDFWH